MDYTQYLNKLAEKELKDILMEEYQYPLFEDDDSKYLAPLKRIASFPARAIRYRKAKSVMNKYAKKILRKAEKIIGKFETELEKSVKEIQIKGQDLQAKLKLARTSNNPIEEKTVINQQKKFKADVEKNQSDRINHLNQSVDNLIQAYTNGIHKRIDEPGYVLKTELSDTGKADLKFLWEEYISNVKQQIYEKLIKIINNKNVKGMETLIARLEVEIEDAEDQRLLSRRSRTSIFKQEKKEYKEEKEEEKIAAKKEKEPEEKPEEIESKEDNVGKEAFNSLKKYLDDELPEGILDDDEAYAVQTGRPPEYLDLYFEIDDKAQTITALFIKNYLFLKLTSLLKLLK
jgi:hypothetical protein